MKQSFLLNVNRDLSHSYPAGRLGFVSLILALSAVLSECRIYTSTEYFIFLHLVILSGLRASFTFRSECLRPKATSNLVPKPVLIDLVSKLSGLGGGPSSRGLLSCCDDDSLDHQGTRHLCWGQNQ